MAAIPLSQLSPRISEEAVKALLDSLIASSFAREYSPLENLLIVDHMLRDPTLPQTTFQRRYVLTQFLITVISEKLVDHRHVYGIETATSESALCEAKEAISCDAKLGNAELLGWSWLHYHYVRVDLGISRALFCQCATINLRTLHRHQCHAIWRLTFDLIEREHHARKVINERRRSKPSELLYLDHGGGIGGRGNGRLMM